VEIKIGRKDDLIAREVDEEHALKTQKRVIFSPAEHWDSHVMRIFTLEEGGQTFRHQHEWPHWVFVLEGEGAVITEEKSYPLGRGSYVFVPPELRHNFENTGEEKFEFMCIVPAEGDSF